LDNGVGTIPGSLSAAITQVNSDSNPAVDTIDFNIPGTGPFTISPTSPLPSLNHAVIIDGYSQPGASRNTQANSDNAAIQIVLSGSNSSFDDGLAITASGCTIEGLAINQFDQNGIYIESSSTGNTIAGNFIGTDATGIQASGQETGILVAASSFNTIGGTAVGARNVISGQLASGVVISSGSSNLVQGNFIGTDATGKNPLGNRFWGVEVYGSSGGSGDTGSSNNTIGGTSAGAGNVIANNGQGGITVGSDVMDQSTGNAILSNSIYANLGPGIDLGNDGVTPNHAGGPISGPNQLQNYPVLTAAADFGAGYGTAVKGTLNSAPYTSYTIQFFASPIRDPSGFGQGQIFLGSTTATTDSNGHAMFQANFPEMTGLAGDVLSATATDPNGNTSEFAADVTIISAAPPVSAADDRYGIDINTALSVPAPGVLANDLSFDGGLITSSVVSGPTHGTVTLNPDGSFVYMPSTDFAGTDTFTYQDTEGSATSPPATVTIYVTPLYVTNTNDLGPGSLRDAIDLADNSSGTQPPVSTILFDIPGTGPFTIAPDFPLPDISHPVLIDGTLQPGYSGTPLIQIDGRDQITGDGLTLVPGSSGSTIQGLCITGFNGGAGIHIESANNVVQGNYLGIPVHGPLDGNLDGVEISSAGNNAIGGSAPGASNRISDNFGNGVEIGGDDATLNQVQGNLIQGNFGDGVFIGGGSPGNNKIGGSTPGASNRISGNSSSGVEIGGVGATSDLVQGNVIDSNSGDGVLIGGTNASENMIGGSTSGASNTISHNAGSGVDIAGINIQAKNFVQGNQLTGNDGDGVYIGTVAFDNTIGGINILNPDGTIKTRYGNVISGNLSNGVEITGDYNMVQGNFIGTDSSGNRAQGNFGDGVLIIAEGLLNVIGGTVPGARNIISGNSGNGVQILGSRGLYGGDESVVGNYIGTDETGTRAVPNLQDGVSIIGVNPQLKAYITIGGTTAQAGNVISGNNENGVSVDSSTGILIQGNSIGTDETGSHALPNILNGVTVSNSSGNKIGGTIPSGNTISGSGNVISGNGLGGIVILSSTETLVEGNYLGTDKSGKSVVMLQNLQKPQQYGIWVINSSSDTIGGINELNSDGSIETLSGNVISGNVYGILITLSSGILMEGNLIGTDVTGRLALGNATGGILIFNASGNTVGGSVSGGGNVISGNASHGISSNTVYGIGIVGPSSPGNQVLGNLIGTDVTGRSALGNDVGVLISDSVGNTIGSTTAGNVIAGNNVGVEIAAFNTLLSGGNFVIGNDIGIARDGTAIGNTIGIWVNDVPDTQIGGTGSGEGNNISGNSQGGVFISGADATNNLVQGNTISGLGPNGKPYYPETPEQEKNPTYQFPIGVYIEGSSSNIIGGTGTGAGNTISGNSVGVYVLGAAGSSQGNTISGNVINSRNVINSERYGILLYNAPSNTTSPNQIGYSSIAKFREFSGAVARGAPKTSGSKAKKPPHHSKQVAHPSARRTTPLAAVTVHGRQVPAGPIRKPRVRVGD